MSVTCYLLSICYSLSDTCYLKLATSCKNLFPFAPVVRLALVLFGLRPLFIVNQSTDIIKILVSVLLKINILTITIGDRSRITPAELGVGSHPKRWTLS